MENKGYIQVYTGNGKGKTTAALGLALRAAGRGKKVYIAQFMKKSDYGEHIAIKKYLKDFITIEQFGLPGFHYQREQVSEQEKQAALEGIEAVKQAMESQKFDIIIMDEANILAWFKIIDIKYILEIMEKKPETLELILTGRNVPQVIKNKADLVTEMKEIKHYFAKGVPAREGIEK
jgi:cob(I)alamin adenosyltransferase